MTLIWYAIVLVSIGIVIISRIRVAQSKRLLKEANSKLSKVKAKKEATEFEQWLEATKDPEQVCAICDGKHLMRDCPDYCPGYSPDNYHGPWIDQDDAVMEEEIDLTGPDPTDLFASEAMKRKRELRQLQESLDAELPENHPKRKRNN